MAPSSEWIEYLRRCRSSETAAQAPPDQTPSNQTLEVSPVLARPKAAVLSRRDNEACSPPTTRSILRNRSRHSEDCTNTSLNPRSNAHKSFNFYCQSDPVKMEVKNDERTDQSTCGGTITDRSQNVQGTQIATLYLPKNWVTQFEATLVENQQSPYNGSRRETLFDRSSRRVSHSTLTRFKSVGINIAHADLTLAEIEQFNLRPKYYKLRKKWKWAAGITKLRYCWTYTDKENHEQPEESQWG